MSNNITDWDTFAKSFGANKKKKKSDAAASNPATNLSSSSNQWDQYGGGVRLGRGPSPTPPRGTRLGGGTSSSGVRLGGTEPSQSTQPGNSARSYYLDKLASKDKTSRLIPNPLQTAPLQSASTSTLSSKSAAMSLPTRPASASNANYEPKPIYLALMGVTGAGKSTFISHCTPKKPKIGHDLHSCTAQVSVYPFQYDANTTIHLVDAPGFNDTLKSDADVLEEIASFLTITYEQGIQLDGILYLHKVTDVRMDGSSMKSIRTLRKICGPGYYKKIMLVTTRWEIENKERGEKVEKELFADNAFWGSMKKGGCKTARHDNSKASAMKIIGTFVTRREEPKVVLDIQKELVDQKKGLLETNAGREVDQRYAEEVQKAKKEMEDLRKDLLEAQKERDKKWETELKRQRVQSAMEVMQRERSYKELRGTMQKRYEENCKRLEAELEKLKLENKRYAASASPRPSRSKIRQQDASEQVSVTPDSATQAQASCVKAQKPPPTKVRSVVQTYRSPSPPPISRMTSDENLAPIYHPALVQEEVDLDCIIDRLHETGFARKGKQCQLLATEHMWLYTKNRELFLSQPMLLELEAPIVIVGDLRGDFHGLYDLFRLCGFPPKRNYLFLGNTVGYGRQSLEVLWTLWAYRAKYPENFFVLRGMNETAFLSRTNGFYDECKRRYSIRLWKTAIDCFNCMPIAALIDEKLLAVSSGISPDLNTFEQVRRIMRPTDIPDCGLMCDFLCSDPDPDITGWSENDRGSSFTYGRDVIARFLQKHDLDLIVRGNVLQPNGYEVLKDSRGKRAHVTLWSTRGYQNTARHLDDAEGDQVDGYDNDAAVLDLDEELKIRFQTLTFEYKNGLTHKNYKKSWREYSPDEWNSTVDDTE